LSTTMKCICVLLAAPVLILAQSYGVSNDAPVYGGAPATPAYPVPFQADPYHDILYAGRRHHHRRNRHSHSRSRSSSDSNEDSCSRLKSKCDKDDDNCEKAKIRGNVASCEGKRGEIVQIQDGKGNLIDYGFNSVEVDVKCRDERWSVKTFEGKRLKVKNVVCYRFALPALVNLKAIETARTKPFEVETFFDKKYVADAINWSAGVFIKNPALATTRPVLSALANLERALNTVTPVAAVAPVADEHIDETEDETTPDE
ncbi:hypothetical protein PFISCL1PPCAC_16312, partial [Pristionchus fissidentatus]